MRTTSSVTGNERFFDESELIVSKTDTGGRITYANDLFLRISGYREDEILQQPHSILRHPKMPRCVFKLMWDTIQAKTEVFAYIVNLCKNGDHYWVVAHVTPSFNANGDVIGYHSNRRVPERAAVDTIETLYGALAAEEKKHNHSMQGMHSASDLLTSHLQDQGVDYDEFIFNVARAA